MAYGVTTQGFVPKSLDVVRAELQEAARGVFGPAVNLAPTSRVGQTLDIFAERISEVWSLGEALFNALNPQAAPGLAADAVAALTGTTRRSLSATTIVAYAVGNAGVVVPSGAQVGQPGTDTVFASSAAYTLAEASAYSASASVAKGQVVKVGTSLFVCTQAGVTGSSSAPSGTAYDQADGTAVWDFLSSVRTAFAAIPMTATVMGAREAFKRSATVILTPVASWFTVTNPLDGVVGYDLETDSALLLRREAALSPAAQNPLDAVATEISNVAGVQTVALFENTTDVTVAPLPPHSFEALVEGGQDSDIIAAIYRTKPGGIETAGTVTGAATNSEGGSHTIKFSRPTQVPVTVLVALQKNPARWPVDGASQVSVAINAFLSALPVGRDVYASALMPAIFGVPGVLNVTSVTVNGGATVSLTVRQRAVPAGVVTVTATDGAL